MTAALSLKAVRSVAPIMSGHLERLPRTGAIHHPWHPPCRMSAARKKPTSSGPRSRKASWWPPVASMNAMKKRNPSTTSAVWCDMATVHAMKSRCVAVMDGGIARMRPAGGAAGARPRNSRRNTA